ncbi:unnamed protein product [Parajaminaea phylloscopi]
MVHHVLPASDGFPLSVDSFAPDDASQVRASCVIINATGVQARFYHDFARWLAQHGVAVCTFDFRFSGTSFPPDVLQRLKAAKEAGDESVLEEQFHEALVSCPEDWKLMSHWTQTDLASVVRFSRRRWPARPLTLLGNSLGGHLATLLDQDVTFDSPAPVRVLNVCGGCAYWDNNANPEGARYAFEQLIVEPLETDRVFRASSLGLGYDLPYGVGRDWLRWYFHPLFSLQGHKDERNARAVGERLDRYLYVGFEDDESISKHMMHQHLSLFSHKNQNMHSLWVDPPKNTPQPWPKCGHVTSLQPSKSLDAATKTDESEEATGAEGYSAHEAADDDTDLASDEARARDAIDAVPRDSRKLGPAGSSPSRLTRQDTIFRLYLDFILTGAVWTHAGTHKLWTPRDERDNVKIRSDEDSRRQQLRDAGKTLPYDYDTENASCDGKNIVASPDQRSNRPPTKPELGAKL